MNTKELINHFNKHLNNFIIYNDGDIISIKTSEDSIYKSGAYEDFFIPDFNISNIMRNLEKDIKNITSSNKIKKEYEDLYEQLHKAILAIRNDKIDYILNSK